MGAKEWRYYYSKAHPEQGHRQIRSQQTSISTGTVIKMACNYEIFESFIYRRELIFLLSEMHLLFKKRNNGTDWELDHDLAPASASGWLCWPGCRMAIPTYTQRGGRAQSPRDGALLHSANPGTNSTHREIHGWQQCLAGLEKDGLNFMQLQIIPQGQDIAFLIASSARPPPPQKGEGRQAETGQQEAICMASMRGPGPPQLQEKQWEAIQHSCGAQGTVGGTAIASLVTRRTHPQWKCWKSGSSASFVGWQGESWGFSPTSPWKARVCDLWTAHFQS